MKKKQLLFVFIWVISISLVIGSIHSWHYAEYNISQKSLKLDNIKVAKNHYGVLHFLTPTCSCSEKILSHLLKRGPLKREVGIEKIVLIDDTPENYTQKLKERGFDIDHYSFEEATKKYSESIRGVPLLIIFNDEKEAKYVGGYSDKLITPFTNIDIKKFLTEIKSGRAIASLPVRGCAVSKEYQTILDPLGIKYANK